MRSENCWKCVTFACICPMRAGHGHDVEMRDYPAECGTVGNYGMIIQ